MICRLKVHRVNLEKKQAYIIYLENHNLNLSACMFLIFLVVKEVSFSDYLLGLLTLWLGSVVACLIPFMLV